MQNSKQTNKNGQALKKSQKKTFAIIGTVAVLIFAFILTKAISGNGGADTASGDLKIRKSEVTGTARFYPYTAGNTKMEVLAVKASDGTIRTAFNTCQVCYDSGRGYYEQEGDELICQNCGNRFQLDQIERIKGGCNPVPILEEYKQDDGENLVIKEEFLKEYRELFGNWNKG